MHRRDGHSKALGKLCTERERYCYCLPNRLSAVPVHRHSSEYRRLDLLRDRDLLSDHDRGRGRLRDHDRDRHVLHHHLDKMTCRHPVDPYAVPLSG